MTTGNDTLPSRSCVSSPGPIGCCLTAKTLTGQDLSTQRRPPVAQTPADPDAAPRRDSGCVTPEAIRGGECRAPTNDAAARAGQSTIRRSNASRATKDSGRREPATVNGSAFAPSRWRGRRHRTWCALSTSRSTPRRRTTDQDCLDRRRATRGMISWGPVIHSQATLTSTRPRPLPVLRSAIRPQPRGARPRISERPPTLTYASSDQWAC
jgi:hypothetical protein